MQITSDTNNGLQIAELISNDILIDTAEDGAQLLADLYYQGFDLVIISTTHLNPSFFDLKSGLAGEVLQKCSNWRIRLTIVGDVSAFGSKSLNDFVFESNKGKLVNFLASRDEALAKI